MTGLSVVCPCLNEADSLPALFARVDPVLRQFTLAHQQDVELILIDDGSTDDTWNRMQALARTSSIVRPVRHARRQGIAAAWDTGVAHARGEWICVLDADLQYQPEEIPRFWAALHATGADIIQGARAPDSRRRDVRFVLSRGLNSVLNRVFSMSLRDNKSGFFLCRRDALARLLVQRRRYRHWQCLVMVAAHHAGLDIHQLDTPFRTRHAGQSAFGNIAVLPTLQVAIDLLRAARQYRGGA